MNPSGMSSTQKSVCIYCASSTKTKPVYIDAAQQLAHMLVDNGYGIRYGGGSVGLMGAIADTVLNKGGKITGVIPRFMVEVEWQHPHVADMLIVETMAERKQLLIQGVDAIIALPGSTGTLEELVEVLSLKKLKQINIPIVIVNTNGFFTPLINMLQQMVNEEFMHHSNLQIYSVVEEPSQIFEAIALMNHVSINQIQQVTI